MPRLLIFDNCEDRGILDQWKPTVGGCRVLITARSDHWPTLTHIRLGLLSPAESRLLLQRLCTRLSYTEADTIAEDLGHLPLALHLAGSYLTTYSHHTVEQYRTELTIAHRSLKGRGALPSPTRHELDVEATFMLSFRQLDPTNARDALALGMLDGAAWCAPGVPIPRDLVLAFVPDETDSDDAVDALRRLQQLGLFDGTDAVVLHRLLAQVVQARLGSTETLGAVEYQVLAAALHANRNGILRQMLPLEPHLRHAAMRGWNRQDSHGALLLTQLGLFAQVRGAYHDAKQIFEQALAINKHVFGDNHQTTAESMNNLALVLMRQGQYKESQALFKSALVIFEQELTANHQFVAVSVSNLALVLMQQGQYRDAQSLFERALAIHEQTLGLSHPDTATSISNLALVLAQQGRYQDAQPLFERALAIHESVLGSGHPITLQSINNVGMVLVNQGRYSDAQSRFEQVLLLYEQTLGLEHPMTAQGANNVGLGFYHQGLYEKASEFFARALAIYTHVFGDFHPDTAMVMNNLGLTWMHKERYDDAQRLFEQAFVIHTVAFGESHPITQNTKKNLNMVRVQRPMHEK